MLTTIDRWAIIAQQVKSLREKQGWAGETHVQKTLFFLQDLLEVPVGYDFVLYKHGPYDFDLHDDLGRMLNNSILELDHQPPYGPRFLVGSTGDKVIELRENAIAQYRGQMTFIADILADKDVRDLERLGTALLLRKEFPDLDVPTLASKMVELKPHVPEDLASLAFQRVSEIEEAAKARGVMSK